ncbi:MAG: YgjP-like metallopeptidase domain-containing protein [Rikenellaceae bacterium]
MEKIIRHPVIGDITIRKKVGNKNIRITVHPVKGVNVSIPWYTKFSYAERFINNREEWIISSIKKQKAKSEKKLIPLGEGHSLSTIKRTVEFFETEKNTTKNKIKVVVSPGIGKITYPSGSSREELAKAVLKILKHDAEEYLPQRTKELADKFGFCYNRVSLKSNKTNWGSCSRLRNINLNIHLIRLPADLADFVILHELCHLKHHNHGVEFHKLLNNLCAGNEKFYSKQLRSHRTTI